MTVKFKNLLEATGMNIKQMSEYFNVPYRTAQDWAAERRTPPDYVVDLMRYKLIKEGKIKEELEEL